MVDSLEIDFVFRDISEAPSLQAIRRAISEKNGFEAEWGRDEEYVYTVCRLGEVTLGAHLTYHDETSSWYTLPSSGGLKLEVSTGDLTDHGSIEDRVSLLVAMVKAVYEASSPLYVYGLDTEHVGSIAEDWGPGKPVTDDSLATNRIAEVSWLMLFTPALVEQYGRDWLLNSPCWKVEELVEGGILLVLSPDPTDYETFVPDRTALREYFGFTEPVS